MLFFEKDDEYEAEVKLLDLLRNHKKDQTSWNTILQKSLPSIEKRNKTLPTTFACFRIVVIFRITYYRRLA